MISLNRKEKMDQIIEKPYYDRKLAQKLVEEIVENTMHPQDSLVLIASLASIIYDATGSGTDDQFEVYMRFEDKMIKVTIGMETLALKEIMVDSSKEEIKH